MHSISDSREEYHHINLSPIFLAHSPYNLLTHQNPIHSLTILLLPPQMLLHRLQLIPQLLRRAIPRLIQHLKERPMPSGLRSSRIGRHARRLVFLLDVAVLGDCERRFGRAWRACGAGVRSTDFLQAPAEGGCRAAGYGGVGPVREVGVCAVERVEVLGQWVGKCC